MKLEKGVERYIYDIYLIFIYLLKMEEKKFNYDWSKPEIFQIGFVFAEYVLFKPTTFIQNCIYMIFRINLI